MFKHGDIIYDVNGAPTAVVIGSLKSNGKEPWCIFGKNLYIGVAITKYRKRGVPWCEDFFNNSKYLIPNLNTINYSKCWYLNEYSGDAKSDIYQFITDEVSEENIDRSLGDNYQSSKEATEVIISFNPEFKAAKYCNSIKLKNNMSMELPSMHVLMRIYQSRNIIKSLETSLEASEDYCEMEIKNLINSEGAIWSSTPVNDTHVWHVKANQQAGYGCRFFPAGVIPCIEIPV